MNDQSITKAQQEFIESIREFVDEWFDLNANPTKEEASDYIARNIDEFHMRSASRYALENGYF